MQNYFTHLGYKKYNGFKPERLREQAKSNFSESILSKKLINYYLKLQYKITAIKDNNTPYMYKEL